MTLTCQTDNVFSNEDNIQWPTCLNGNQSLDIEVLQT